MLPTAVSEHYRAQQRLVVATLGLTRSEWAKMGSDWDASWSKVAPRVNLLTASAQAGAAANGAGYIAATLAEYGEDIPALGSVNPRAFAGIASDGRPLASLLDGALYRAKASNSLAAGGKWLDMAVHTAVADAGRGAASVAIAARPGVGYVRMVNPPSCGPCAVLAGRQYRYSQGFQRHPRCDCIHVPTTLANPFDHDGVSPTLDQITDLTEGERKALLEGGDLSRVINARRGGGLGKMTTTELAGRGRVRLTPDGIFATAKDRAEALRLLQSNGYITPTGRTVRASTVVTSTPAVSAVTQSSAKAALERTIKGKVSGLQDDFVPERVQLVADTLADLKTRYGVEVHNFGFGNVQSQGVIRAAGDADFAGNMRVGYKSVGAEWRKWETLLRNDTQMAMTFSGSARTNALKDLLLHEYGHVLDFALERDFGIKISPARIAKKLAKEQGVANSDYDLWIRRQMSNYGNTNREETIAEAFLDVESRGDDATDLSKRIHAEIISKLRSVGLG